MFIFTKKGLEFFSPIQAAAIRIFCASISVLPIIVRYARSYNRTSLIWLLCSALLGNFFPVFLVSYAQTGMSSAITGVLNSLMPCFAFVVGMSFFKIHFRWLNFAGLIVGALGTCGLVISAGGNLYVNSIWPVALMLLSVCMHGFNINIIKHKLADIPPPAIIGGIFMFVGPLATSILIKEQIWSLSVQPGFWSATLYLALVGVVATNVALLGFNYLIKYTSAIFAASVTYIIPVFAIVWGILDGEPFLLIQMVCAFVILGGVYLVNKKT